MATLLDLFLSQITDVFRIGLIAALLYTTQRTRQATGTVLPLLAGIVFVAVIIPTTQGTGSVEQIAVGLLANAAILAVLGGLYLAYLRARR